jgi:DNA-binding transcriptional ArsR family regulator
VLWGWTGQPLTAQECAAVTRVRDVAQGELAGTLGLAPPAMSRHLKALKDGGLVEDHYLPFDARVRIYRLKDGATDALKGWLAETESLWSEQLAAFKAHVERGAP